MPMLIETQSQQQIASENIATTIISTINEELERRLNLHKYLYNLLWNDNTATAQEICDKLFDKGLKPIVLFEISTKNIQNIQEICGLFNKNITDFIAIEEITPKQQYIINENGSLTFI